MINWINLIGQVVKKVNYKNKLKRKKCPFKKFFRYR